ncbi:hypothetical protein [Actinocatenispora rupis]|uniref:Uncharacterized protein n=1 Tax=Actinocatenispora rupis TaxID=519421 RepID=A0A8J3N8E2_9ACTN|nr:hypothetical protein [Actinocatenispora rupis]GID10219.1 hypothetical protein Aru02nite_11080 [Actinocatenispora rupis]
MFPSVDDSLRYEIVQDAVFLTLALVLRAATCGQLGRTAGRTAEPAQGQGAGTAEPAVGAAPGQRAGMP